MTPTASQRVAGVSAEPTPGIPSIHESEHPGGVPEFLRPAASPTRTTHVIFVHGRDAYENWGAFVSTTVTVKKLGRQRSVTR